jgi:hypothetical protein
MVTFSDGMTAEELQQARRNAERGTKLLAFFDLCDNDQETCNYKYSEIPTRYTWDASNRRWKPRTKPPFQDVVSRIYTASIANMELYSLRLLLLSVPGPTSFEDLRTFEGTTHETFQAAANARGLLESDMEWDRCLQEAGAMAPAPKTIRLLFCYILVNCAPADPLALWLKHRESMVIDYEMRLRHTQHIPREAVLSQDQVEYIHKRALGDIDEHLRTIGNRLCDYPTLPQEIITDNESDPYVQGLEMRELREYHSTDQAVVLNEYLPLLNLEQKHAYDRILAAINSVETNPTDSKVFFLNGAGGTGKSLLFKTLLSYVRSQNRVALPVATSGIAAILLPGGRTAHSRFKIPLNATADTTCNVRLGGPHAHIIANAMMVIWDEAVMCNKSNFQAVDRLLRDIMGARDSRLEDVPFGGKVVVFGGDFRQLLPVVPRALPADIINDCIRSCSFWNQTEILHLKTNMRVQQTSASQSSSISEFAQTLLDIGDGRTPLDAYVQLRDE